ncbi:MAG: bifunctional (p)ppGpp synthetase/guanosine-3',5'-bis(diphosphate) 3'-pyrophosphohydrolase [Bacteroidaceae bacterium]|nr:bifunctional (p)ppGpp synthetase/guanosine-3',5'-bis(diphosphate) 3'-pyrophosphohydrolase [Bacteroidaceae bacterium]MCF0228358.1 bifunctional (p)ppGpp synthetase/guanosine-3',5'-bis(diphosphate) 3'-pyrophosphohydrolase [Parasporobacterium sp.]
MHQLSAEDAALIASYTKEAQDAGKIQNDWLGRNPIDSCARVCDIAADELGLGRNAIVAILLTPCFTDIDDPQIAKVKDDFGETSYKILISYIKIRKLYERARVITDDNFRNLLMSLCEDVRVLLIVIAETVAFLRHINELKEPPVSTIQDAALLYAPLAHKLGLYKLKSEIEDLSLKYIEHDAYYHIKEKLNATKAARDKYMQEFIEPIEQMLTEAGLKFHIKGRTKSIHSIWQKMKKQNCPFEGVYDLFAIRIILDSPLEQEKVQCWQVYALITNRYQPNPKRMRDWLSVPKSNGYECLHITVLGPQQKWVEVQIRTERMDAIAENGLAAHWRYKGVQSENGIDTWLGEVRRALETSDNIDIDSTFSTAAYDQEVFVFTPKGELKKFPKGATVLDFAYAVHTKVGNTCTGAKINGKAVPFRYELQSGDNVEILTSSQQKPKQDWLNMVVTGRAKSKIRMALKETQVKDGLYAKEMLERRLKNRKVEMSESTMSHLLKKFGYKETADFYRDVANSTIDMAVVIDKYIELKEAEDNPQRATADSQQPATSAENFVLNSNAINTRMKTQFAAQGQDVLVIGRNLKGVDYSLARCCNPIYGDKVFGFVTINDGIKIHRCDCPNAKDLHSRYAYRIVKAVWSGKGAGQYDITLHIVGNDDIGIMSNISNVISKEEHILIRSINIDSNDGLFSGTITISVEDQHRLNILIKKLQQVKGVRQVNRL